MKFRFFMALIAVTAFFYPTAVILAQGGFMDPSQTDQLFQQYENSVERYPGNSHALVQQGRKYQSAGNPLKALEVFHKAIRIDPENAEAHLRLGVLFEEMEYHEEATSSYREALHIRPEFLEPYIRIGSLLGRLNHLASAREYLGKAKEINSKKSPG